MERIILASILLLPTLAWADEPKADTIQVVVNPENVVVVTNNNTTSVVVNGKKGNKGFKYMYTSTIEPQKDVSAEIETDDGVPEGEDTFVTRLRRNKKSAWSVVYGKNLYVGWVHPVDCPDWIKGSWEIGLSEIVGVNVKPWKKGPVFGTGVGFGFKQLLAKNEMHYAKEGEVLTGIKDPAGRKIDKSRVEAWSIHIPVNVTQKIYRDFAVQVGGVLNLNTYTTAFSQLKDGSQTEKTTYKGLHQRFFTCDLVGVIGWTDALGVYVRYSPMTMFDKGMGPGIKTLSVGAMFNF